MLSIKEQSKRAKLGIRNIKICAEWDRLYKTGLRNDVIMVKLADQFFLSALTVEAIVFKKGVYREF